MPKRFFEIEDDLYVPRRWHLDQPTTSAGHELADDWQFTDGRPIDVEGRLKIRVEHAGTPLDFTFAGLAVPVVHSKVASIFAKLAPDDVQLIPVDVGRQREQYVILVATRLIRCVDEKLSRVRFWTQENAPPGKAGQYASVRDLHIDKSKVGDAKVFRVEWWEIALVVSEDIKTALERIGATGVKFEEV